MAVSRACNDLVMIFLRQASAFIITYPVNNAIDKERNKTDKAVAWEKAFIQLVKVCFFLIIVVIFLFFFLCNSLNSRTPMQFTCLYTETYS